MTERISNHKSTSEMAESDLTSNKPTLAFMKPFNPVTYELEPDFRLTRFADLKGRGWKVPQDALIKLLEGYKDGDDQDFILDELFRLSDAESTIPRIGIGMDCSLTPLKRDLSLVQSTNLFYTMVEDPYMQGKIACSNVLSNLYAMGVTECDNILMLTAVSTKMTQKERDVVFPLIMRGFKDCAINAGTRVTGGETIMNPWCTIGGVATSVCNPTEIVVPTNAMVGDVLIVTKPLGTQIALSAHQWLDEPEQWNRIKYSVSEDIVKKAYQRAVDSMSRLNRTAASLLRKYQARCATDISGFGILGHAKALARNQKNEVTFSLHNLPIIAKMSAINTACRSMFQLLQGNSPEYSGGLLICLPRDQAASFCKELERQEGRPAWIVGIVEKGERTARLIEKPRVIEVPAKEKDTELW